MLNKVLLGTNAPITRSNISCVRIESQEKTLISYVGFDTMFVLLNTKCIQFQTSKGTQLLQIITGRQLHALYLFQGALLPYEGSAIKYNYY